MLQKFDERNRNLIVNVNGELVHRDEARISPFDSSVQGGDAVWEGLRLYRGRIFRLDQHLERLARSARALAFAQVPTREQITGEIRRTLAANSMFDGVHIRLTLTRGVKLTSGMDPRLNTQGPTLIVLAEHKAPVYAKTGLSLVTSSVRRFPPDCLDPKIHHSNLIQSILAKPIIMTKDEMMKEIPEDCSEDSDGWYHPGIEKWASAAYLDNFFLRPADPEKYDPKSHPKQ